MLLLQHNVVFLYKLLYIIYNSFNLDFVKFIV